MSNYVHKDYCKIEVKFSARSYKNGAIGQIPCIIIWQGKSEHSDWFFLGRDFAIRTVSVKTVVSCVCFVFESRQIQNKHGPGATTSGQYSPVRPSRSVSKRLLVFRLARLIFTDQTSHLAMVYP